MRDVLEQFEHDVFYNVMLGRTTPKVTDREGKTPIVATLDCEPLSDLVARVKACDGCATIYSLREDGVIRVLACYADTTSDATDMTENPPSGMASIGLFIDYLERQNHGVVLPDILPHTHVKSFGQSELAAS